MQNDKLNLVCELHNQGVISLHGAQRNEYLQGQVTIDVNKITENKARRGCHCDFKGKTWSVFTAVEHQEQFLLSTAKGCLESSLAQLKKYGVFSKVDIVDASDQFSTFAIMGKQAADTLLTLFPELPEGNLSAVSGELGSIVNLQSGDTPSLCHTYVALLNEKGKQALLDAAADYVSSDSSLWEQHCIASAIAEVKDETVNEFVPQMLNMQTLDAIDFDKGCYMGQETVARTKFLGRNKRASYILKTNEILDLSLLQAGSSLEKQAGENWRSGGTILRSTVVDATDLPSKRGTWILAVLANDTQVEDVLRCKEQNQYTFSVQALPYELD